MNLKLRGSFFIGDITPADKPAFIQHFAEKQISDQTTNIPYPYTEADAERWVSTVAAETLKLGQSVNWAIRRPDGYLVGGIGFHGLEVGKAHKAELGYWLAKPYWGQGIMTEAVTSITQFGFSELGLVRVAANVFDFNQASAKVLEKSGFTLEGQLRKYYCKNGNIFDRKAYAKVTD